MKHHFLFTFLVGCYVDAALIREVPDKSVCPGKTLILNWRYDDANETLSVFWFKDSVTIMFQFGTDYPALADPQNYRIKHIENGEIHVINVTKDDAGMYRIHVRYNNLSNPTVSDNVSVTVIGLPSSIEFNKTEWHSGRRKYTCNVANLGDPPVTVKMKLGRITINSTALTVGLNEPVDCCVYGIATECLADHTSDEYCENIFTPYGPGNLSLSPATLEYTFNINETLPGIVCSADCDPPCEFSWTKDGSLLNTVNGFLPSQKIYGREDNGIYRCTATRRSLQTKSISIIVNVRYGPDYVSFYPPTDEYIQTEGEVLTDITCVSDCYPGCTYKWTNDSTDVAHTKTLSLGSLHSPGASRYFCSVKNNVTNVMMEKNLTLYVTGSPRPVGGTSPVITALQDTKVVLSLIVLAYPPPTEYVWYKRIINDWMELYNYASILTSRTSLQFNLTISNFKQEDYGEYKLTVENGIGNHLGYVFTVKRPADEPQTGNVTGSDGLLILSVCLGILLAIALFTIVVLSFRKRLFRKGLFGDGRHKGEKDLSGRRTGDIPMSSLEGTDATATSGDNIAADHVYDEMRMRASQEHSYGQLEHNTGSAAKAYENFI